MHLSLLLHYTTLAITHVLQLLNLNNFSHIFSFRTQQLLLYFKFLLRRMQKENKKDAASKTMDTDLLPNPSDLNYKQLTADLTLLDPKTDKDYQLIESYFSNTKNGRGCQCPKCSMSLNKVWRVNESIATAKMLALPITATSRNIIFCGMGPILPSWLPFSMKSDLFAHHAAFGRESWSRHLFDGSA